MRGDKSFANDLYVQRGIVSSRVALLLRSAEIKPQLSDLWKHTSFFWLALGVISESQPSFGLVFVCGGVIT